MAARISPTPGSRNVEFSQQFDLPAGKTRVDVQLASSCNEVFLQHLHGHNARAGATMCSYELNGASLFSGRRFVVAGVDRNII